MGWSGSITASSAVGASTTYTPDSPESTDPASKWVNVKTYAGNYSVSSFTAPKRGVYQFILKASGGAKAYKYNDSDSNGLYNGVAGGTGGSTTGYLLLEAGQTVYVGAGGVCRAAFVSSVDGSSLSAIDKSKLYLVAGAGGSGAAYYDNYNETGYNCKIDTGGNGGGTSGAAGSETNSVDTGAGGGGTQSAGGAAGETTGSGVNANGSAGSQGVGGTGSQANDNDHFQYKCYGGRGGDGYYGGGGGSCSADGGGISAAGGGGGSGYVKTASFTHMGTTYKSTTSQGGGAASNKSGSVVVKYYAMGELPITFNGTKITELIFNGTKVTSVYYNGTKLF